MSAFHRITDKTKAFFGRVTRRPRSMGGDEDLAGRRAGDSGRGPVPYIRAHHTGPSLIVTGIACPDKTAGEAAQASQYDLPYTSPQEALDTESTSHTLQTANQSPGSLSSSSPRLEAPSVPSYFSNASAFTVGQVGTGNVQNNFGASKTIFEYLEPYISHGAAYNSDERCDAPTCDPETRRAVQEDIVSWMRDGDVDDPGRTIMWLAGPAGSGKTAIAGSVAETCKESGILAASFFFSSVSGSADRHSKRCVVATIALHLAEHEALHEYNVRLLALIQRNPTIFRKRLIDQAHYLLLQPLRAIQKQSDNAEWPKCILLDGLDEVLVDQVYNAKGDRIERTDEEDQVEILEVLLVLAKDPVFPFRIFISSRPERVINDFFATTARDTTVQLFLDSKYDPDSDIRRFLYSKFASIRRRYGIHDASWPGERAFDRIVEMSSGQFIVPATIVRHIAAGVPQRQLDDIMQLQWVDTGRKNPFAIVDALYTCILRRSPEPHLAAKWLRAYTSSTKVIPASYYKQLVEDIEGEFHHVLGPLSSLVSIPKSGSSGDYKAPLLVFHKSLSDYLASEHRCADLYLDDSTVEAFVAERCVGVLRHKGPAASLHHSPQEIGWFLDVFYVTTLVNLLDVGRKGGCIVDTKNQAPFELVARSFADSLLSMSPDTKTQLASCDVAWWTRLCLCDSELGTAFISGMYCGIHVNLCGSSSPCHAACTYWRAGILAEAKALNWCVHKLEEAELKVMATATDEWFDNRFRKMGEQADGTFATCSICQPHSLTP